MGVPPDLRILPRETGAPARDVAGFDCTGDYAADLAGTDTTIEVWCTEDEVEDIGEPIPLEDAGEIPGAGG